jgi:RNA polymerase sigma-70 factor (ECF subfamily)
MSDPLASVLSAALLSEVAAEARDKVGKEVRERTAKAVDAARARWPEMPEPGAEFTAHLLGCARKQPDLVAALPRLRIDDLLLAWWASRGDAKGIAAFEEAHAGDLERLLRRFHRLDGDELSQRLRIKLFTSEKPKILEYSGFGFLENWYRVIAARTFLDVARSQTRERTDDLPDAALAELVAGGDDPGSAAEKAELLGAIKKALEAAIADLAPRDRTFLRHQLVDELSVEQIAVTYKLHRVTVSRSLSAARKQLQEATRARLVTMLGIDPARLASAIRILDSQLDLSLKRVLRSNGHSTTSDS